MASRLVLPLVAALRARKRNVAVVLASVGLEESALRDLHGRLTMASFLRLCAACIAETGDPAFPLDAARYFDQQAFPLALYLLSSQTTVRDGAIFGRPYRGTIIDGFEFVVEEHGPFVHVDYLLDEQPVGPPELAEYLVGLLVTYGHLLAPNDSNLTEIWFAHDVPCFGDAPSLFYGAPVRFGAGAVRFVFPKGRLDLAIAGSDPQLGKLLARQAEEWRARNEVEARVRDRVHRHLADKIAEGQSLATKEIPRAMRMSGRTLRRRLQGEGTSIREILDDARRAGALELLRTGRMSVDEIAFRLGFSGASAFRRAFRRWTGGTPAAYRGSGGEG